MRLLDRVIQTNTEIFDKEVDDVDYIVMSKETFQELAQEYSELYNIQSPTLEEVQEIAGARIVIPLIGNIHGEFQFCKGIRRRY